MSLLLRPIAVLKPPARTVDRIKHARAIVDAIDKDKVHYPAPNPALAAVTAAIDGLAAADAAAKSKAPGAVMLRANKAKSVTILLDQLRAYVQQVADTAADPTAAEALILGAMMFVKQMTPRQRSTNEVRQGATSGSADLLASVVAHGTAYEWQSSVDAKIWTAHAPTSQAHTTITGLTPGITYSFRFKPVLRKGQTDWSQVLTLLVK